MEWLREKAGALLFTAGGLVGFVAFAGGAVTWARFYAAKLPADEAVAAVPKSDLVVAGARALSLFAILGAVAVLAIYLSDSEGKRSDGLLRGLLSIATVECVASVALESGGHKYEALALGAGIAAAGALAVWAVARGRRGTPFAAILGVAAWVATGLVATLVLGSMWLVVVVPLAVLLAFGAYATAHATKNEFQWFAVFVFFSIFAFGGITSILRELGNPQLRPVALVRKAEGPNQGVEALFVADSDNRVWLASVATRNCSGEQLRGATGRLFSVPQDEVESLVIGPPQRVQDASRRAPEMLADLVSIRLQKPAAADQAAPKAEPQPATERSSKTPAPALPQPVSSLPVRREPLVRSVTPRFVDAGREVTIAGEGFTDEPGRVRVGRTLVPIVRWTDKSITVRVRRGVASGHVRVECHEPVNQQLLTVRERPSADAAIEPIRPGSETYRLDGSESKDPQGGIIDFSWRVHGKEVASGERTSVKLPPGRHTITLVVTDSDSQTRAASRRVTVPSP